MSLRLRILRAGPLATIQDAGRTGMLRHGIGASGPMDGGAFDLAGGLAGGGHGGIELTMTGIDLAVTEGRARVGFAGGDFTARVNGARTPWPGSIVLQPGDLLSITPGHWGNYGYLRFERDLDIAPVMGSIATSSRAGLGGIAGRALRAGDEIILTDNCIGSAGARYTETPQEQGRIRIVWGIHADHFAPTVRDGFVNSEFIVSSRLDRMGVRLEDAAGVFVHATSLSLVSDAIVPGDIQILGDGTPIVLMRDHQPTGGYPRIATVITADLNRFAQLRPHSTVAFQPVTVEHAHHLLRSRLP